MRETEEGEKEGGWKESMQLKRGGLGMSHPCKASSYFLFDEGHNFYVVSNTSSFSCSSQRNGQVHP